MLYNKLKRIFDFSCGNAVKTRFSEFINEEVKNASRSNTGIYAFQSYVQHHSLRNMHIGRADCLSYRAQTIYRSQAHEDRGSGLYFLYSDFGYRPRFCGRNAVPIRI